jgi:hypothetical protein
MVTSVFLDTDVRELFPEFRQNSVLRFSRLFPIKPSHKPKIWKNLKRKKIVKDQPQDEEVKGKPGDPVKMEEDIIEPKGRRGRQAG